MFCPQCGTQLSDQASFCPTCGTAVARPTAQGRAAAGSVAPGAAAPHTGEKSGGAGRGRRGRTALLAVVALVAVLGIGAAAVFLLPGLLSGRGPLGAAAADTVIAPRDVVSDGTYDYYYSSELQGVVRARCDGSQTSVIYPLAIEEDEVASSVMGLSLDGDSLFLSLCWYSFDTGESTRYEVHRIPKGGGDGTVVFALDRGNADEGEKNDDDLTHSLVRAAAYEGKLYAVVLTVYSGRKPYDYDYQLYRMDLDGSNQETLALVSESMPAGVTLAPERLYYAASDYNYGDESPRDRLCSVNLDGSDFRVVYDASGLSIGNVIPSGGRLYFTEANQDEDVYRLVSVAQDGTDVQTVYEVDDNVYNVSFSLLSVRDATAYVALSAHGEGFTNAEGPDEHIKILGIALEGEGRDPVSEARVELGYVVADTGDRFVAVDRGYYYGDDGARPDAYAVTADGEQTILQM